jgi:hypothetical protein
MGDEHDAERDAQDEGAIRGETGVDHDCLRKKWFDRRNVIASISQINSLSGNICIAFLQYQMACMTNGTGPNCREGIKTPLHIRRQP